jgi:hypothetical protein
MIEGNAGEKLQAAEEAVDLIRAEINQRSRSRVPFLSTTTALNLMRMAARKASARMARVIWRYQPCQERIS